MRCLTLRLFTPLLLLLILPATAEVEITSAVVGNGGGVGSNANYTASITVGQSAIGPMSGEEYDTNGGFWYQEEGDDASEVGWPRDELPAHFALSPGQPNPSRRDMTLWYAVPRRSAVSIRLYDVLGRRVRTLVEGEQEPGHYQIVLPSRGLAGGIYFCQMRSEGFSATRRLVLLR